MALTKQPIALNFSQGLDTKADPYQVQVGKFLNLTNSIFDTTGRLTKRNGFGTLTSLPDDNQTTLTTLNDNLLATGSELLAYSKDTDEWYSKGKIQPIRLDVQSLVRNSANQTQADMGIADNGLACVAYSQGTSAYYQIIDSSTGQQIIAETQLSAVAGSTRVYVLGRYFIITFISVISAANHLQYLAIPVSKPNSPLTAQDVSTTLTSTSAGYDAVVANNSLYISWADTGTVINTTYLSSTLVLQAPVVTAAHTATLMSVTADNSGNLPVIWVSFWDSGSNNGYSMAFNSGLAVILAPTQIITSKVIREITGVAINSVLSVFYENFNNYNSTGAYPVANIKTDFISKLTVTQAGSVSSTTVMLRSVGLASKAFLGPQDVIYMLITYGESNQPTYFLSDSTGAISMRLAYANGGGYQANQILPNISLNDDVYSVAYLIKDFLTTVNKGSDLPAGTPVNAIYTQTGVNAAKFSINTSGQYSSEIADSLHLTGGQLWDFDGVKPVEDGFHVWPENVQVTTNAAGGSIDAGDYEYVFVYEWTDNTGKLYRSAPSIPFAITTTGATSTNTCYVPTLRLTYKITPNPVRIVGYRWSVAQQIFYQFTSVPSPTLNNPSVDYVVITDTLADSSILGNNILYTTGGVIENIAPPANIASTLFKNRLFLIDAEDQNLLWYSKQVIESVPVEMSDLLTLFVAPTTGVQGSTGPMTALSAMDDKLIIFKANAIYYITGLGPDNTGANNDFTDPVFITSSVGCANPNSIAVIPNGIMFQSNKGIWLLGRDLQTTYIGNPVEAFNSDTILSAKSIPGTNQVRFILDNNVTLLYDYFFDQWGQFTNIRAISSVLYQNKHSYLNEFGTIYQETSGIYLDGSSPVLMSFTTSWINAAGLQGYERFYFANLLGTYHTPFKLNVGLSYDYSSAYTQQIVVQPDNFVAPWGGEAVWGSGPAWGGPGNVFSARLFPQKQKCQSFQLSIQEMYDPSLGQAAGQGLSLSGLAMVVGVKKGYRTQRAAKSFG